MVELLELLELVQAGMALLTRGRRNYNWQVTHWATDAAEEALALLMVATATDAPLARITESHETYHACETYWTKPQQEC